MTDRTEHTAAPIVYVVAHDNGDGMYGGLNLHGIYTSEDTAKDRLNEVVSEGILGVMVYPVPLNIPGWLGYGSDLYEQQPEDEQREDAPESQDEFPCPECGHGIDNHGWDEYSALTRCFDCDLISDCRETPSDITRHFIARAVKDEQPEDAPDPLDENDHRDRIDRDGDRWTHRGDGTYSWCIESCYCSGVWDVRGLDRGFGPLSFADGGFK